MSAAVTLNALVVSLATTAAVHFGDVADQSSGEKSAPNLEGAGHAIEILALLGEKTKGNLGADEEQFLKQVLFDLRMRFVEAKKEQAGQPSGSGPIITES